MKKLSTRTVLIILLVVASLSSYVFLSTRATSYTATPNTELTEEQAIQEEVDSEQEIILPDVQLLKKAIEAGKRLVPTS
ncbi:MAG: hypothetical protein AAF798_18435 [Bacteroidota bacterium]